MLNFLDNANFNTMQKSLDIVTQRMKVTAQNISNVNTPFYKAKKLEFENLLEERLAKLNNSYALQMRYKGADKKEALKKYLGNLEPVIYTDKSTETRVDGNNVDIDYENLEMARIQLQYSYMIRKVNDEYNLIRHAINEGR